MVACALEAVPDAVPGLYSCNAPLPCKVIYQTHLLLVLVGLQQNIFLAQHVVQHKALMVLNPEL
jgi:hypothetical protein